MKPRLARLLQRSAAVALPEGAGAPRSGGLESWKGSIMVFWIEKKLRNGFNYKTRSPFFGHFLEIICVLLQLHFWVDLVKPVSLQ